MSGGVATQGGDGAAYVSGHDVVLCRDVSRRGRQREGNWSVFASSSTSFYSTEASWVPPRRPETSEVSEVQEGGVNTLTSGDLVY